MNSIDLSELVFGGYSLTLPVTLPGLNAKGLLPDSIVTASDCLSQFLPDSWALSWTQDEKARERSQAAFGIDAEHMEKVVPLVDDLFNAKRVLWTRFMTDRQTVAAVLDAASPSTECRLLGLALHGSLVHSFIEDMGNVNPPESTIVGQLAKRAPLPPGGSLLGFEILGFEVGAASAHSWLCNHLHDRLFERHGVRPGPHGLLTDYAAADEWSDAITRERLGEPVLWLPWGLVEYAIAG